MEISEVLTQWEVFKDEFQEELNDFNKRTGKYNRRDLLERTKAFKEHRGIVPNMQEYLAVADLIKTIVNSEFNKMLDECASERGWDKSVQDIDWENDKDKFVAVAPIFGGKKDDYSDFIPCGYEHHDDSGGMINISSAGRPLIKFVKNEGGRFKVIFNEDTSVQQGIREIDTRLRL